ncbi:MAG: hypothetical protein H6945_04800 [Zoogloeaceae bacterium]|nr:hypothetical protein [Rhodocyclaceae bacterium]MCP5235040.1 hypothetical protein [Zoogloeaceae bacterium]
MDERQCFERIADEIASGQMDRRVWIQALAMAEFDHERARAIYARLRNDQLGVGSAAQVDGAGDSRETEAVERRARCWRDRLAARICAHGSAADGAHVLPPLLRSVLGWLGHRPGNSKPDD